MKFLNKDFVIPVLIAVFGVAYFCFAKHAGLLALLIISVGYGVAAGVCAASLKKHRNKDND